MEKSFNNWNWNEPNDDKESGILSADYGLMSTPLVPWDTPEFGTWNDHFNDPMTIVVIVFQNR